MKKLGVIVASIAGIAGLVGLGSGLWNNGLGGTDLARIGFTTQQAGFDCTKVTDVDLDQCKALLELYTDNPNSPVLKKTFEAGNTLLCDSPNFQCTNRKITYLNLGNNQISNINALKSLTSLTDLYLYTNQISDINALDGLKKLKLLRIFNNKICGPISPTFNSLTLLQYISIGSNYLNKDNETNALVKKLLENDTSQDTSACPPSPPTQSRYSCSTTLGCYPDPNGKYADLKSCDTSCISTQVNVDENHYSCDPSAGCYPDPNGKYADLKSCNSACVSTYTDVDEKVGGENARYGCDSSKGCYEDPNGKYADLKSCNSTCVSTYTDVDEKVGGENPRYSCSTSLGCEEDPNGKYTDLKSCDIGCGYKDPVCGTLNDTTFYDNESKCANSSLWKDYLCADKSDHTKGVRIAGNDGSLKYRLWSCNGKRGPLVNPYDTRDQGYSCFVQCGYCGDKVINDSSEQCDDGNSINNDTCDNMCKKHG